MMKDDFGFMSRAIELARQSDCRSKCSLIGCVIVLDGTIIDVQGRRQDQKTPVEWTSPVDLKGCAVRAFLPITARRDFSTVIKRHLEMRAAYFCSNSPLPQAYGRPRLDGLRGLRTGHAAHICAASKGGPRYDPSQSEEERRSSANGLWLCRECGDIVDKDENGYSAISAACIGARYCAQLTCCS
jgi:tRNA(Arg) A34 adenosine deaminase TadA